MGKTKVKVTKKKGKSGASKQPKLIGSAQPRTIIHFKYNSKGQRRRHGWK